MISEEVDITQPVDKANKALTIGDFTPDADEIRCPFCGWAQIRGSWRYFCEICGAADFECCTLTNARTCEVLKLWKNKMGHDRGY